MLYILQRIINMPWSSWGVSKLINISDVAGYFLYTKKAASYEAAFKMVDRTGLEPVTSCV